MDNKIRETIIPCGCSVNEFRALFSRAVERLISRGADYSTIQIHPSTDKYDTGIGEFEDSVLVIEGYRSPTKEEIIQGYNGTKQL